MPSSVVFGPSWSSSGFVSHPYEPIHQEKSRLVRGSGSNSQVENHFRFSKPTEIQLGKERCLVVAVDLLRT